MKNIILVLSAFILTTSLYAQVFLKDPLREYSALFQNSLGVNLTRINTNFNTFDVNEETYTFLKNDYLLTPEYRAVLGFLFHKPERRDIYMLRTGFNFGVQRANLIDPQGDDLRLTTNYLSIPVDFQIRHPLTYKPLKNDNFRAVNYGFGTYLAAPIYQKLDRPENIDASGEMTFFNYLRFGLNAEISFSTFNDKGHGHQFGIRTSTDFANILELGGTDNKLYPFFSNVGVFYNLSNSYYKKKEKG